jgi:lysophospholipase L1-like esterase
MNFKDNYSLLFYGDSISKGIIYDSERSRYITLKESFANIIGSSIKGSVYNAGKFGNTIIRGFNKVYNDVVKRSPDIVLVEFGGNDCDFNWGEIAKNPYTIHRPNTDIATFRESLLKIINVLKEAGISPILMTLPPLDSKRYFNWISNGDPQSEQNILKWLGSVNSIFTWHNKYSETIAETASETKTPLIDVRSEFLMFSDYSQFLCKDGIHPNNDGHLLIAEVFLNFFRENYEFLLQKS